MELKQKLFAQLARDVRSDAILATNTSSISITKIAASTVPVGVSAASPEGQANASRVVGRRFLGNKSSQCSFDDALGLHFFNPVPIMVI